MNQMWILKNSIELLEILRSPNLTKSNNIKTFSMIYTTISRDKLKPRLFEIIDSCFFKKNGTLLLAEIFLYSHEAEFTQKQETNKIFAVTFNSTFR